MKKIMAILLLLAGWVGYAVAQNYPPEWIPYTGTDHLYDIQHDNKKSYNGTETAFKEYLKAMAQKNLMEKVRIEVRTEAASYKEVVNGKTNMFYLSVAQLKSEGYLEKANFLTKFDQRTQEGWAIAYINKSEARTFYENRIKQVFSAIESSLKLSKRYLGNGSKSEAKEVLENAKPQFAQLPEAFFWFNFYGGSQDRFWDWVDKLSNQQVELLAEINRLKTQGTTIYVACNADMFGNSYPDLQSNLKGALNNGQFIFTDYPDEADWIIDVRASAREFNITGDEYKTYHVKVDGYVRVTKAANGKQILEKQITMKGSHMRGYDEAARIGYKNWIEEALPLIQNSIKD